MQRTTSSSWVRGLADMFAAHDLDLARLFHAAGVEFSRLDLPDARFTADEVTRLWEVALARSGNSALGIDRETAARYSNFDVVGHAVLSQSNLRSGLQELARYLALISSATTIELRPEGDNCWVSMGHTGYTLPLPWQRSAYSLLGVLTLCRWSTRRDVRPVVAHFSFPQPLDPAPLQRAFGCPVRFEQEDNVILISGADLAAAIPSHNPALLALHEKVMEERLAALGDATTSHAVSDEIIRRLHRGEPRREDIAASLGVAERTLRRRLEAEGTSYQQLLDETRRELARRYLADAHRPLVEVSDLLGFVDSSNFFRACKRWFGQSPGQYRQRLGPAEAA
ncbi:MAG: AraC family transcriptional regulator [Ramlibacter sp.]